MVTAKNIIPAALLSSSAATYYTVPANTRTVLKKLTFMNAEASASRTVTVYIVPSAGSASDANMLVDAHAIGPGETWDCYVAGGHVLEASSFIQALADSASKVSIRASGVEIPS